MKSMSVKKFVFSIVVLVMFASLCVVKGNAAYTIDGNVSDWGVYLNNDVITTGPNAGSNIFGYLNTHLPTGGASYATRDITANYGAWHTNYYNQQLWSPKDLCSAAAIYANNDGTNLYLAVIEGLPIGGLSIPTAPIYVGNSTNGNLTTSMVQFGSGILLPGDIALKTGNSSIYNFALKPTTNSSAELMKNGTWVLGDEDPLPYRMNGGSLVDMTALQFAWGSNSNGLYVMEASIPLADLGFSPNASGQKLGIEWTMACGNNDINLDYRVKPSPVPEPATMALVGFGLVGMIGTIRRKLGKNS